MCSRSAEKRLVCCGRCAAASALTLRSPETNARRLRAAVPPHGTPLSPLRHPMGPHRAQPTGGAAVPVAAAKTSLAFVPAFVRGILCNWLVCMAVYLASFAKDGAHARA